MTKKWYNIELGPKEWAEFREILQKDGEENGENGSLSQVKRAN